MRLNVDAFVFVAAAAATLLCFAFGLLVVDAEAAASSCALPDTVDGGSRMRLEGDAR